MGSSILKNIVTKKANTWEKTGDGFPEVIRSSDGTIVRAEYVELPSGELMIMEYEIDPDDAELMKKVHALQNSEAEVIAMTENDFSLSQMENDFSLSQMENDSSLSQTEDEPLQHSHVADTNHGFQEPINHVKDTPRAIRQTPAGRGKKRTRKKDPTLPMQVKIVIPVILAVAVVICVLIIIQQNRIIKTRETGIYDSPNGEILGENALSLYTMGGGIFNDMHSNVTAIIEVVEPEFHPHSVPATEPSNMISSTAISVNDVALDNVEDYEASEEITFNNGLVYTDLPGVITFRGNNFRNSPAYGYAEQTENRLEEVWSRQTGALTSGENTWSGSGWTGQPLLVQWPKETKQHMNMYDWAKEKDDLVEVIYACMDGNIYFTDLETGEPTRDTMSIGYTFKGAGALDPRGYPIMYLGAGINSNQGIARVFVINLLDCSVMYTFGNSDGFAPRSGVSFFDSSALVDAETDTLIYPGENGVLYLVKLGTNYNEKAGTLSINPQKTVKWTYYPSRNGSAYWYGMEDSAVIYKGYLFIMDNGGNFMCLDLNTLQLVWVQDSLDDSNSTPVLSIEDGKVYLYASTSFHLGWRSSSTAPIPIWKVDAETGEIVWQHDYECQSIEDLSGGVQSTIAVGQNNLEDYIYVTVSRTGGMNNGVLACISKDTGEVVWEHEASYAWSSPVCVYNSDGSGRVIYPCSNGKMYLLDGLSGEQLDAVVLSEGVIEASPAVFNDRAVVGTRACQIKCVELK